MLKSSAARILLFSLIFFAATVGLFGNTGSVYAADRTVLGEMWSADN
ncbi:MAG: hypothetical protein QNL91_01580 [Candidatus Krumholzibacteria bacterium]|nr:hypothetical protein [Candidatus Krumholzibacteria bacterium]